jgi:DNA sulfur modification protein DndD
VLLEKRDGLDHQIEDLTRRRDDLRARLKAAMSGAWTTVLSGPINAAVTMLSSKENDLRNAIARIEVLASMNQHADGECPACLQKIGPEAMSKIEAAVGHGGDLALIDKRKQLSDLTRRLDAARSFASTSQSGIIQNFWDLLEDAEREFFAKRDQREDLDKQLGEVDEASLRGVKSEYETNLLEINALASGVQITRKKLDEKETAIDHVRRRLERASSAGGDDAQKRARLYTDLHDLFSAAVDAYRERLRKSVEADATKHFLKLTTEREYKALSINDSYGLTIVHRDGEHIPVRSAGAEHVVALSLIGALQNNAPLRGPIVIDSPFGRLDSGHTRNIVRALPTMAEQVVLLVYEEELPPALARAELQGKLLAEYKLDRRSARHTELAPKV